MRAQSRHSRGAADGAVGLPPVRLVPEFFNSLLVVAPHPDDEVIGCGGLIRAMRDLDRDVRVVVVSDGAASHPKSEKYRPATLAALRRTESITALATLGVAREHIHFCEFADGQSFAWGSDARGVARLASAVSGRFDLVAMPSEDDGHPDHAKTRELARAFMTGAGLNIAYTVWPRDGRLPVRAQAEFVLDADVRAAKRAALSAYATQLGAVDDDPDGFIIDAELFERFTGTVERFTL